MIRERITSWVETVRDRLLPLRADDELQEEMMLHIDIESERLERQGLTREQARTLALQHFGDPRRIAQDTRNERRPVTGVGSMHDLRFAIRMLGRNPAFTIICLLTLAVGIGAATTAFTVLDTVLLRPLAFAEPSQLMLLRESTEDKRVIPPSFPNFTDWREQSRAFAGIAAQMYPYSQTAILNTSAVRATMVGVSNGFFQVLGVTPIRGRTFLPAEHAGESQSSVMVSQRFWIDKLGGRKELGTIVIGDRTRTVIGVVPQTFHLVGDADVFFPAETQASTIRSAHNYVVVARLAPGATLEAARVEMRTIAQRLRERYGSETEAVDVDIVPLREYLVGSYTTLLTTVFVAASLVLLIACINLVCAQLARGMSRRREFSIRTALGASRIRVARQLFIESAMISVAGAAGGVLVATLMMKLVSVFGATLVPRLADAAIDLRVLAFTAALTVLTTLTVGLYPAFRLASTSPSDSMRTASRTSGAMLGKRAWSTLVGFEIALAVVLVIGSTLLVRTMRNILGADIGFDPRGVVTAAITPSEEMTAGEIARIHAEVAAIPGVRNAAFVTRYPLQWGNEAGPVLRPSDPPDKWPALAGFRAVSAGYFEVMHQTLLKGRVFSAADDSGATPVAIITTGLAARLWPGEDAVGKIVRTNYLSGKDLVVAGVVAEASSWRMAKGEQNEIFVPLLQHPSAANAQLILVARTESVAATLPAIRARLHSILPLAPATMGSMEERIANSAADRRFATLALGIFAGVALVLAGVGVYGVMSYGVASRTHELGVRMALGASPSGVRLLVLRSAGATAAAGIVSGVAISWFASRLLASLLYGVAGSDIVAYATGGSFLLATALLAAFVPAWRASRIDPLAAIRAE